MNTNQVIKECAEHRTSLSDLCDSNVEMKRELMRIGKWAYVPKTASEINETIESTRVILRLTRGGE